MKERTLFLKKKIKAKEQRTKLETIRRWARTSPNRKKINKLRNTRLYR